MPRSHAYAALFGRNGERILPADSEFFTTRELVDRIERELAK